MVDAKYYQFIYLLIVSIVTFLYYNKYKFYNVGRLQTVISVPTLGAFALMLIIAMFIGLRPESYLFVDMMNYLGSYNVQQGNAFVFDPLAENLIFDNLFDFWCSADLGFTNFMLLISLIYFGCMFLACRRFFPKDTMVAFLVFLGAFSTFSYATNGIKAGAAASIFVMGLSYYKNWKMFILLLLVSLGMHHSMQLPVAACILAHFYRKPKHYLYGWGLCVLIAAAHITFFQSLFASMSADTMNDARGASYLNAVDTQWGGKSGFRPDFVLYSAMPVLVGYYAILRRKLQLSDFYIYLLNVYIIINSVWMLCMYAEFTNRIAYLSWLMYPVVLIYPFLKENWGTRQYQTFAKVMMYHLGFTIFMEMVYYGGFIKLLG